MCLSVRVIGKWLSIRIANVYCRNCDSWTSIDLAAENGRPKMIKLLLDHGSPIDPPHDDRTTPLHLSSRNGHAGCVKLLLEKGADVKRKDVDGSNCMELAIDHNHK